MSIALQLFLREGLPYIRLGNCSEDCSKDKSGRTDAKPADDQESFPGGFKCLQMEMFTISIKYKCPESVITDLKGEINL